MDDPATPLRAFLAERDARCPGCGYCLRGLSAEACPECGLRLALEIAGPARGRAAWAIVLVLLGWVTLASLMGAWRGFRDASAESVVGQTFVVQTGGTTRRINIAPGQPVTVSGPGVVLGGGTARMTAQRVTISTPGSSVQTPVVTGIPVVANLFTRAPTRTWSAVAWQTWARLGGWGSLGSASLAALSVAGVLAWRREREAPGRLLVTLAGVAFGLYACGQIVAFVHEAV